MTHPFLSNQHSPMAAGMDNLQQTGRSQQLTNGVGSLRAAIDPTICLGLINHKQVAPRRILNREPSIRFAVHTIRQCALAPVELDRKVDVDRL